MAPGCEVCKGSPYWSSFAAAYRAYAESGCCKLRRVGQSQVASESPRLTSETNNLIAKLGPAEAQATRGNSEKLAATRRATRNRPRCCPV